MAALEAQLGVRLFTRERDGYRLTADGTALAESAETMAQAEDGIQRWFHQQHGLHEAHCRRGLDGAFSGGHLPHLALEGVALQMRVGSAKLDLIRRQADIGVRNSRLIEVGLAGRPLDRFGFALYAASGYPRLEALQARPEQLGRHDWLIYRPADGSSVPSAEWAFARLSGRARLLSNDAALLLEATCSGAGISVLPCFAGDAETGLVRVGEPIAALSHDQWLVVHDDPRALPAIRHTIDAIVHLWRQQKAPLSGEKSASG